jgi:predicted component of type VI protein secretion system
MSEPELRPLLAELHERLRHAGSLDADSRQLLTTVAEDIEQALATDDGTKVASEQPLESLAVRFEAEHPALAGVLRQTMDTLGKAGI